MKRVLIRFAYDGSKYLGYQIQHDEKTIQKELVRAIEKINNNQTKVDSSGRTDRGVHAYNQYACFNTDRNLDEVGWKKALNGLLPKDIYIKEAKFVDLDFHPRFNVLEKTYLYKINTNEMDVFNKDYIFQLNRKLDIVKMKDASQLFLGEHDFRNFCSNEEKEDYSFNRIIYDINIVDKDGIISIFVKGNGFMRYMVRNMIGSLIEIGLNKKTKEIISSRLDELSRNIIPFCAPSEGLYLFDVKY